MFEVVRRAGRYGRLGVNLLAGSAFIQGCHSFPSLSGIGERHLNDYRPFNYWVKDLVRSMNTELEITGESILDHALFVSNHISWLDTIVLNHAKFLSFIARHDLVEWPGIGTFTQRMHSVYVDRSNKFQAYRSLPALVDRLNEGRSIMVFPESTTSDGAQLLHFYPMFYEAAVRTGLPVQPVALSYHDAAGKHIAAPAFIDDDSFVDTLDRIFKEDRVYARLNFLKPLDSRDYGRKELAWLSRQEIGRALSEAYGPS